VLYRTQLFEPQDIENVKNVQAGYRVQPLSEFLGKPSAAPAPAIDFIKPLTPEQQRTSLELFNILNFVLHFCPTHPSEQQLMSRFAKLGIGGGRNFDAATMAPEIRKAVEQGMADAWKTFGEFKEKELETGKVVGGDVVGSRKYLGNNYLYRMAAAALGIYGNSKEEAMYPTYWVDSSGAKLSGADNRYKLRFAPGQLPPVNAFWSLTMYELPASLLYANPLNRYLINSPMLPHLKRDADGGLSIYIQHESPGREKESNWLPAPNGPFFLPMRLYWPKAEALNGQWKEPALQRVGVAAVDPAQIQATVEVTADNFIRAETDMYFGVIVREGGFGKLSHHRDVTPIDKQPVIRSNRDTLYSSGVFDLDAGPVTITLPEAGKRFQSMQTFDEDHYVVSVVYGAGKHTFSKEKVGTRYILVGIRTLVDPNNPQDIAQVHALQDAITVQQPGSPGRFETPNWEQASQKKVRDALLVLAATVPDTRRMFGAREEVDPVRHLIGTAMGWGGNPEKDAFYLNITPKKNDGKTVYKLTVKDVPVDAFWSISVYNAEGYFERNRSGAYTLNNITAKKGRDGAITVQFGGCDGKIANCLPIVKGWNYLVRLYRPRPEILNGTWRFPDAEPSSIESAADDDRRRRVG
jgi:hypothetical protein